MGDYAQKYQKLNSDASQSGSKSASAAINWCVSSCPCTSSHWLLVFKSDRGEDKSWWDFNMIARERTAWPTKCTVWIIYKFKLPWAENTLFGIFLVSGGLTYHIGISERDIKKFGTCQKGQISSRDLFFLLLYLRKSETPWEQPS